MDTNMQTSEKSANPPPCTASVEDRMKLASAEIDEFVTRLGLDAGERYAAGHIAMQVRSTAFTMSKITTDMGGWPGNWMRLEGVALAIALQGNQIQQRLDVQPCTCPGCTARRLERTSVPRRMLWKLRRVALRLNRWIGSKLEHG